MFFFLDIFLTCFRCIELSLQYFQYVEILFVYVLLVYD